MNKSQIVKNWVKNHSYPTQSLCPHIIMAYPRVSKDEKYGILYDISTNQLTDTGDLYRSLNYQIRKYYQDNNIEYKWNNRVVEFATPNSLYYEGLYADYDAENKMLEYSIIRVDAHRPKIDQDGSISPRNWYFTTRVFFFNGDADMYYSSGDKTSSNNGNKRYNATAAKILREFGKVSYHNSFNIRKAFIPFTNNMFFSSHYWIEPSQCIYPWMFEEYYKKYNVPHEVKDPMGLSEINHQLQPINADEIASLLNTEGKEFYKLCLLYERINENLAVLRYFDFRKNTNPVRAYGDGAREQKRVFVTQNGNVTVYEGGNNSWGKRTTKVNESYKEEVIINREDMKEFKPFKYIYSLIPPDDSKNILNTIINILRHPIVENFAKAGYPTIAKQLIARNEVAANLKYVFGTKKESKNIYQTSGMNKFQLKLVEQNMQGDNLYNGFPKEVKRLADNFSALDNNTSEMLINSIMLANRVGVYQLEEFLYSVNNYGGIEYCGGWYWSRRHDIRDELTTFQRNSLIKIFRTIYKSENPQLFRAFKDTVKTYCSISDENRPDIKLYELKADEIQRAHDVLVMLSNDEYAKRQVKNSQEQIKRLEEINKKRREKFEFLNDDVNFDFIIITPKKPVDIVNEGAILHHCVGGYVEDVCSGKTNILFLRKKSEPEIPFYTIEVNNYNKLIQVHGTCNKWIGNNPEAIPFLIEWLKKAEIQFNKNILLCTALGYSRGTNTQYLDGKQFGL